MTVFVDEVEHAFGNMKMCHMWADTLDELLTMVDKIGVDRKWIQGHPTLSFGKHRNASWVHFDISKAKKAKAISLGAVLTDRYGPLDFQCKTHLASGNPELAEMARRRLEMVYRVRAKRALN